MGGYRHPLALVVEDDDNQRALLSMLLEESDMEVLECDSAEAAVSVLDSIGESVWFLFTDENLAGTMSGAALAAKAKRPVSANGRGRHIKLLATGIAWRCQVHAKTLATIGRAAGGPARDKHTPLSYRLIGADA